MLVNTKSQRKKMLSPGIHHGPICWTQGAERLLHELSIPEPDCPVIFRLMGWGKGGM